ncbi:MAG: quinolinate synthase NadA, partial [Phycisphaerae bacterium]|nr:quinolinate synthase NadA [Phycisphaerae bacterium]
MMNQVALPQQYRNVETAEMADRIAARKARLGENLCILGHHYQRDEVVRFADFTGDSLKL